MNVFHPTEKDNACSVHQNLTGSLQMTSAKSRNGVDDLAQVQICSLAVGSVVGAPKEAKSA